jgi:uncharacterized protein (DUF2062 family)
MSPDEPNPGQHSRFARFRRAKMLLRFLPRRAVMHKYPLVGRFASAARKRAYLWSFRTECMRPAFYAGSILSLLPVMGVQTPLALVLAVLLRANFMVLGGLQLLTNPFTAAPIYYATHQLGAKVIELSGFGHAVPILDEPPAEELGAPEPPRLETARQHVPAPPAQIHWTRRAGTAINALVIGGVISGALLGLALDLIWRIGSNRHLAGKTIRPRGGSRSTEADRPPQ